MDEDRPPVESYADLEGMGREGLVGDSHRYMSDDMDEGDDVMRSYEP